MAGRELKQLFRAYREGDELAFRRAAQEIIEEEEAKQHLALARVTPHTLRRRYISIMLGAGAEVPYVQGQVGHKDPAMTLKIYALVLKRRDRSKHGAAFDQIMRDAIPSMQHANMHVQRPLQKAA